MCQSAYTRELKHFKNEAKGVVNAMNTMDTEKISRQLSQFQGTITMCADGFIDEVWEIVDSRASAKDFTLISKMTQFADRINVAGTGGLGMEIVKKRRAFGGFTANIGYAAACLGVNTNLAGIYGKEKIDPIFSPLNDVCNVISLGDPAVTLVLEFGDGKILMTDMEPMLTMDWKHIVDTIGKEKLVSLLTGSDILGVGYWSLFPAFDEIVSEICAVLPQDGKVRRFFFDFADVRKRDGASLAKTLKLLGGLNDKNPMILSVNEHEAAVLFALYNETFDDTNGPLLEKAANVRKQAGLAELVIHTPHFAAVSTQADGTAMIPQEFCEKPVRTAGAGDTFNGGYIAGILAGLDINERLYTASNAVSFFLNNGHAPSIQNLVDRLKV